MEYFTDWCAGIKIMIFCLKPKRNTGRFCSVQSNAALFEKDYYSHLLHMRKPDADIFESVLAEHKLDQAETLFIDDSLHHIK